MMNLTIRACFFREICVWKRIGSKNIITLKRFVCAGRVMLHRNGTLLLSNNKGNQHINK